MKGGERKTPCSLLFLTEVLATCTPWSQGSVKSANTGHIFLFVVVVIINNVYFNIMNSDAVILLETVNFAAEKHRNQRRKDTEQTPYINHPIGRKCVCIIKS